MDFSWSNTLVTMSIGNYSVIKEPNAFTKNYDLSASKRTLLSLTLYSSISQNGQTHSNNSSAISNELFECVWPFCGIGT